MVRTQGVDTRVDTKGNPPPPIFERQMKIWYPWASVLDIFPHMGQPSELYTVQWGNLFLKVFPREEERKDPGQWSVRDLLKSCRFLITILDSFTTNIQKAEYK
jgi:hypothetical protein